MRGEPPGDFAVEEIVPVDLDGGGIRDLLVVDDALLVLAGPTDDRTGPHRLFRVGAPRALAEPLAVELPDGTEGMALDGDALVVVTDGDGEPGKPCATPARWARVALR
jgi:hypothetical protein